MVPFVDVVDAVTLEGDIGVIGIGAGGDVDVIIGVAGILGADIGSGGILGAGINENLGSRGVCLGSEGEVPVFVDPLLGDAIRSTGGSVPAGAEAAVGLVGAMVEVDFPDE